MVVIAADIGGTKIAVAAIQRGFRFLWQRRAATPKDRQALLDTTFALIDEASRQAPDGPAGIGVGVAGLVDFDSGRVIGSPNLPLSGFELRDAIRQRFSLPTYVDNDANLAALAEHACGAGQGLQHIVGLTIGTGVGGGIIIDGNLYRGWRGAAGEIGHMIIQTGGPRCGCGRLGCLEALASGSALERMARERIADDPTGDLSRRTGGDPAGITGELLEAAAREGSAQALEIFYEAGRYLGVGLGNILNIFNPHRIVLGGGVARAADLLLETAAETMWETALGEEPGRSVVAVSQLGNDAGLMGAAALVAREENLADWTTA